MGILHIDVAHRLHERWAADPATADLVPYLHDGLRTGRWDREYLDTVGQMHDRGPSRWPPEQVAAFGWVNYMVMRGEITQIRIATGACPFPDKERALNQQILDTLVEPFTAEVDPGQHNADCDGRLSWSRTVISEKSTGVPYFADPDGAPTPLRAPKDVPAAGIPLEIGSTLPSRTLLHLGEYGGVARWPYESTVVRVLISSGFPKRPFRSLGDEI